MQATQSVKWNEMYKWKDDMKQDVNLSWYVPKAHHKWPRNCCQHLRPLGHHTKGTAHDKWFITIWQASIPFCMTSIHSLFVWQAYIPFLYDKHPFPFCMTNIFLLFVWQASIPFLYDKYTFPFCMTSIHSLFCMTSIHCLFVWQASIPFLHDKHPFPFWIVMREFIRMVFSDSDSD